MLYLLVSSSGESRLHMVASTATKATNDPQLLPHSSKEGWWAVAMTKSDTYGPFGS